MQHEIKDIQVVVQPNGGFAVFSFATNRFLSLNTYKEDFLEEFNNIVPDRKLAISLIDDAIKFSSRWDELIAYVTRVIGKDYAEKIVFINDFPAQAERKQRQSRGLWFSHGDKI